ncbi:hypothetical protein C7293_01870 [filamentous cyanobacterium CCT1]|nr:hypothetical protein C7293_01870 [filamentous cyanobacterium CCT1]PSN80938.1 hypothetical protein C8B47_04030 [filamentous cyanobacterium CCP4]
MIEAAEETAISSLQALASYGTIATRETWEALKTPENVPIFLSSLIKFSLGPTLAFLWGRKAFNYQENFRREQEAEKEAKEAEAFRLMLELEMKQNLDTLEKLKEELTSLIKKTQGSDPIHRSLKPELIAPPSCERAVYSAVAGKLPGIYKTQPEKLSKVVKHYQYLTSFSIRYETEIQPKHEMRLAAAQALVQDVGRFLKINQKT